MSAGKELHLETFTESEKPNRILRTPSSPICYDLHNAVILVTETFLSP